MKKWLLIVLLSSTFTYLWSQDLALPPPIKSGGKPLMDALNNRKSNRNFIQKEISGTVVSSLLWAAWGFNRENKRTAPSSQNRQEVDLYIMFTNGIYFYDAKNNMLKKIVNGDYREMLGQPDITNNAAFTLIYVVNLDKASNREAGYVDSGFIAQNVYLYCASIQDLGAVVRASFKRPDLHKAMNLSDKQEITIVQAVGFIDKAH